MTGLTVAAEALTTKLLKETREELAKADAKASMLGAAALVLVGAVLGGIIANNWSPAQIDAGPWRVMWWVGVGLALGALVCFGAAVFPRLRAAETGRVTYFKDVVEHDSCAELVPHLNLEAERDDRDAEQLWRLSSIANSKYQWIRAGQITLLLGAIWCGLSVLFGH